MKQRSREGGLLLTGCCGVRGFGGSFNSFSSWSTLLRTECIRDWEEDGFDLRFGLGPCEGLAFASQMTALVLEDVSEADPFATDAYDLVVRASRTKGSRGSESEEDGVRFLLPEGVMAPEGVDKGREGNAESAWVCDSPREGVTMASWKGVWGFAAVG